MRYRDTMHPGEDDAITSVCSRSFFRQTGEMGDSLHGC